MPDPRIIGLLSLAVAAAIVTPSCSEPPAQEGSQIAGAEGTARGGDSAPCPEGSARSCHVQISEHDGVIACLDGEETCAAGRWGPCEGGSARERPRPAAPEGAARVDPLSLSAPTACDDNPCDPTCQSFDEAPDGGVKPDQQAPSSPWSSGDPVDLPQSILDQGSKQPCSLAADCQFDERCQNPSPGACSHHPCAPGEALFSTCSPCVEKICAADPTCCIPPYIGNCAHDVCTKGAALKSTCDPCAAAVCAQNPGCCVDQCTTGAQCPSGQCDLATNRCKCAAAADCPNGSPTTSTCVGGLCGSFWGDTYCTGKVASICGKSCPGPSVWGSTCAAKVGSLCGAECNIDPPCGHDKCYTGQSLDPACDPCVAQICASEPACCTPGAPLCTKNSMCPSKNCVAGKCTCSSDAECLAGSFCQGGKCTNFAWTSACVDLVMSSCGESCPSTGSCQPWLPGQTDPKCAGVDLTVGVACDGTVPVCNRGSTDAPAGIELHTYPPGSAELPGCNPAPGALACTTSAKIPAGQCISVSGCAGLVEGALVRVNPPGPAHVAECRCENDWSIYHASACQEPACAGTTSTAVIHRVSMFVAVDRSTSMRTAFPGTPLKYERMDLRWNPATQALESFFADPASAGLGVALRFWPDNSPAACDYKPSCPGPGGGGCAVPLVPWGTLTAQAAPVDAQEQALVDAINAKSPLGETPMYPALDGAETWAKDRKTAFPDETVVVVFITDGMASQCDTNSSDIALLAQSAFQSHGVRTYVIGIAESNEAQMNQIAAAGGGAAFFITEGANVYPELLAAMLAIRGDNISCTLALPAAGLADPSLASVEYTPSGGGAKQSIPRLADASACGDGWYFDDPADPKSARLCPATCGALRGDIGAKVQVASPCAAPFEAMNYAQTYAADCPAGSKAQWGTFTYATAVPGDASVEFSVRTADRLSDLATAPSTFAATATQKPDTQVCGMGGPLPCPIDLFTLLGGPPRAREQYLELEMLLAPTKGGKAAPAVLSWELTYSCPPSE